MQILQICKKYPYPPKDGESVAIYNLAASLQEAGATIDLLAMNTSRHEMAVEASPVLSFYRKVATVPVDNHIKLVPAFLNLFSDSSYHIERFVSSAFAQKLEEWLQQNDYAVVQLETLYLAPYIPVIRRYSRAKICLRAHNVEHEIWERIVDNTPTGLRRRYLAHLTPKLKQYEVSQLPNYDLLAAISQRDLDTYRQLGYSGPGLVVPVGFDPQAYEPLYHHYSNRLSIGFIGSLDWIPNLEGLDWFLQEVWPGLHAACPDLELHIAGRNTPERLLSLHQENISVHGEVADAQAFIKAHTIALVPLRSGSGMRVKILEAMALGKVVLTTSLGLEGIPARDGQEVLLADEPAAFLQQIQFCQIAPDRLTQIGQNARHLVEEHFDRSGIAERLLSAFVHLVDC